jgi:hypothetical protein
MPQLAASRTRATTSSAPTAAAARARPSSGARSRITKEISASSTLGVSTAAGVPLVGALPVTSMRP